MNPPVPQPRALPSFGLLAAGAGAVAVLLPLQVAPQPPDPGAFLTWWEAAGTDVAVIALLRLAGLAAAAYVAGVSAIGCVASVTASVSMRRLWRKVTPTVVQRMMVVGVTAGVAASCAMPVGAQDAPSSGPALIDLGPASAPPADAAPSLVDLGASTAPAPLGHPPGPPGPVREVDVGSEPAPSEPGTDRWTVEAGDHLWSIAEETLRDRGATADTAAVARYWQRLIDANRAAIGADEDLVHPGLVLVLPT